MNKYRITVISVIFLIIILFTYTKWHQQKVAGEKTALALRNVGREISKARLLHAFVYAPKLFKESEKMYETAMQQWRKENEHWYFSRNFDTVIKKASEAEKKVKQAVKKSGEHRNQNQKDFEHIVSDLSSKINEYDSFCSYLPLPDRIRNKYVKGQILYSESQKAGNKGEFNMAYNKAKEAASLINPAHEFGMDKLHNYFNSFNEWDKLNKEALNLSRSQRVIMVDKVARRCYVYKNGKAIHTFVAELGRNWVGKKTRQGDDSTPEGKYRITKKLKGSQTKYYKALLINYPNDQDRMHFSKMKASGEIPRSAQIGGLIEIHGGGGKGADWTNGCVALTNKDMDKIFSSADVDTHVYIVGSLVSLDELKKRKSLKTQDEE